MDIACSIIDDYLKAKQELGELFNIIIGYDVEYSEHEWYYSDGELSWWNKYGEECSEDATFIERIEGYQLFLVYGSTGDKYLRIVNSSMEM